MSECEKTESKRVADPFKSIDVEEKTGRGRKGKG